MGNLLDEDQSRFLGGIVMMKTSVKINKAKGHRRTSRKLDHSRRRHPTARFKDRTWTTVFFNLAIMIVGHSLIMEGLRTLSRADLFWRFA